MTVFGYVFLFAALLLPRAAAEVRCRFNTTAPTPVTYYTCTELALKYGITIEHFFMLNPLLDPDCSSIQSGNRYCVAGNVVPVSTDGSCKPEDYFTCLGYSGGQCCNSETWKCGQTKEDCRAGTCATGLCSVKNPSDYSLDGTCGSATGNKICGGKWGDCCGTNSKCGTGQGYCGLGNCLYGECVLEIPTASPTLSPSPSPSSIPVGNTSPDGTCGGANGFKCSGSAFGDCCSLSGFCGNTDAHCKGGCQSSFGNCTAGNDNVSLDGSCGGTKGYICSGSGFGDCCSSGGWCGSSTSHCTAGCQAKFGTCAGDSDLSLDGTCGGAKGYKCTGSGFGDCCSAAGYCGGSSSHCTGGCQAGFGTCSGGPNLSPDGTCGGSKGYKCAGSGFGDCCSAAGYCGSSSSHCAGGCQSTFGTCSSGANPNASPDGSCGGSKKYTCAGTSFGTCCSAGGYCGSTVNHCAQGCQKSFSSSCLTSNIPSLDGACGSTKGGFTCSGGPFNGQCCGSTGFCGQTDAHCKTGCQKNYGTCK